MKGIYKRTPAASITSLPGSLPVAHISDDVDPAAIAPLFIKRLDSLSAGDFTNDALWRDSFALTGTLRTFFSAPVIDAAWKYVSSRHHPTGFTLNPDSPPRIARHGLKRAWVEAGFTFETDGQPQTKCSGFISLVPDGKGGWRIWLLRTILEELKGHGNPDLLEPRAEVANGTSNGINGHAETQGEAVNRTSNGVNGHAEPSHFDCVVIGAGQAGLGTAGHMKALGVSCLVVDRNARVGDNWMLRYDSVKLHTTRQYAHLPGEKTFGPEFPIFLGKKDLATGYQRYVDRFDLNVWLSTELEASVWNEEEKTWTLKLRCRGEEKSITASHLVFAVGAGCTVPSMPNYPNSENFKGTILHSADYKNPSEWKGKPGIVIGSANTAHDVAEDMIEAGLSSVTMVQRGTTYVLPAEYYCRATEPIWNDRIPTELADRLAMSIPTSVARSISLHGLHAMAREEPERFEALEKAGFKTERFGDLYQCLYERFGGHYMDIGVSAKIVQGLIKMKSDATPTRYTSNGLEFSDGTEILADIIVFTTGFLGNMRQWLAPIIGQDVADRLEDYWLVDKEGELRGAFKPTGHPALWYMGGTIGHARYYSRFVALQIQADLVGTPLEVYQATPSAV